MVRKHRYIDFLGLPYTFDPDNRSDRLWMWIAWVLAVALVAAAGFFARTG